MTNAQDKVLGALLSMVPPAYFAKKKEQRRPLAPVGRVICGFILEVLACAIAFAVMLWIFATTLTQQTTIVDKPKEGATCATLTPKRGVVYYGKTDSENAQYAGLTMNYSSCVDYLTTKHDVCADGNRLDLLVLWGVSNPNNSQYFPPTPKGSQGYFSFTPSQTAGLSTQLKAFAGASASFPKPDISRAFTGTATNWNIFNFRKNTASDAFTPYPGVRVSDFLYDTDAQMVYDPDMTRLQTIIGSAKLPVDYDLSGGAPDATVEDLVTTLRGKYFDYDIIDLIVSKGVYYGILPEAYLGNKAVDAAGNVFVIDLDYSLVRRIDAMTQAVTSLGTSASPTFNWPRDMAVDTAGNVYVADTGNNMIRRIDAMTQAVTSLGTSASPAFDKPSGVAVDAVGDVIVIETGSLVRVRRIDAETQTVSRFVGIARVMSKDMLNPDASGYTRLPNNVLGYEREPSIIVDSAAGGCQNVFSTCYLLGHAEYNAEADRIYVELQPFYKGEYGGYIIVNSFGVSDYSPKWNYCYFANPTGKFSAPQGRQLLGVFKTPVNGILYFTSGGVYREDDIDSSGLTEARYTDLVTATNTMSATVVDASKVPAVAGSPPRYLMLLLLHKGSYRMYTYDTFKDSYISNAAAATTHYMLGFTWGICSGTVTRSLVELTFSNDYTNECEVRESRRSVEIPTLTLPLFLIFSF